jgi:hypothetical protein
LFGPSRKELQKVQEALAAARAESGQLRQSLAQCDAQRAALEEALDQERSRRTATEGARDALAAERDTLQADRDAVATEHRAALDEIEGLRRERDALAAERAATAATAGGGEGETIVDRSWALVLADLERRWAAGVGALPDARGVSDGPVPEQLAEGLTREVERLREEMGVDVSLTRGKPVAPARPVVFLLAATDLLGALAATCERVAVAIDDTLVLTGEVWIELGDDLEVSRTRALDAGVVIDPIDVDDERVRITLRP